MRADGRPPGAGHRLEVARVVGRARPVVPAAAPSSPVAPPENGPTRYAVAGALGLVIGLCVLIGNFVFPWLVLPDAIGDDTLGRSDLADAERGGRLAQAIPTAVFGTGVADALIVWPVAAYVAAIFVGFLLLLVDVAPIPARGRSLVRTALATLLGAAGFVLALTGARWVGNYFVHLAEAGEAAVHLHVVPYLNAAAGVLFIAAAVRLVRHGHSPPSEPRGLLSQASTQLPRWALIVSGGALVVLPFLPFLVLGDAEDRAFVSEGNLDALRDGGDRDFARAADALASARAMLWAALLVAAGTLPAAWADRSGLVPWLSSLAAVLFGLIIVPVALGIVFAVGLYVNLARADPGTGGGTRFGPNFVVPVALLALLYVLGLYAARVIVPFVSRAGRR